MGPEATAEFYKLLIKKFQSFGFYKDSDFPEITIFNLPLPDVVESKEKESLIVESLKYGLNKLNLCDILVSPCNTANIYLRNKSKKIINLIDLSRKETRKYKKVGILATRTTQLSGVYSLRNTFFSKEQDIITEIIINILKGEKEKAYLKIKRILIKFEKLGCDAILLGCTELPLIISQINTNMKVIDTLDLLAEATVNKVIGESNE